MPYIGNASANRFVASKAATQFSGDGSTTAFTLDHSVGADEDILVSVDGVIQEPSVAYAVSGTTLTFTAAPSSNSGNNIFVYYLFRTVATVDHPSTSALTATSGTFTGAFTSLGIDDNASSNVMTVSTGGFTLSPATSNLYQTNGALSYYGTTNNVYLIGAGSGGGLLLGGDSTRAENIYISASSNNIQFTTGSALGMTIDANGHVTKPLQPAFLVRPTSTQSNISINAYTTIVFDTEVFDNNSDFASNTFTAPVTGKYQFNCSLYFTGIDTDTTFYQLYVTTSNREHLSIVSGDGFNADPSYHTINHSVLTDMDANDTCYIRLQISSGGSSSADLTTQTRFSGYLVA